MSTLRFLHSKQFLFTCLTVLFVGSIDEIALAQWTTSGANISNTNTDNVGIGTTNPATKLDVRGGQTSVDYLNGQDYSTIGFHDASARVDFIRSGNGTIQLGYDRGYGAANIGLPNGVPNSIGNVGIGTINPGAYKLAVEGKIGVREVEVKTGSRADFVFKPEYELPSLKEVEKHIKAKQHLSGIPSEAEVKEKGYALGAMDAKLLQKIEELTLYMIGQQNQISEQQKQTDLLKNLFISPKRSK